MQRDGCSVIGTQIERIKADWSLRSDNRTRVTRRDGWRGGTDARLLEHRLN